MVQERKENRIGIRTVLNKKEGGSFKFIEPVLNKLTGMSKIRKMYEQNLQGKEEGEFIDGVMNMLNVTFSLDPEELNRIPKEGPVIVVANHPFGAHDAILMASLLKEIRNDYKIMANGFFSAINELQDRLILVNAFKSRNSENRHSLRESVKFLKEGGILGVFPSGTVSHYDFKKKCVTDPEWSETIAGLVQLSGATVVPVHFSGRNSLRFNLAGMVHPALRTALLPREMMKRKNEIQVHVGHPIDNTYLCNMKDRKQMTDYIRMRCYLQKEQIEESHDSGSLTNSVPVIDPVHEVLLQGDIDQLTDEDKMLDFKDYSVYCTKAEKIPSVMREIGRLREITFREVGEGTGKALDLDEYDEYYLQLFIWNRETKEVVGAYRIGEVCSYHQRNMLYTNEFYDLNREFFQEYSPGLEMGRSFVRKEYQRKPYSLMLLWKGICEYVARNPRYRYLFGAVSVSSEYSTKSRGLIANLLVDKEGKLKSKMPATIELNGELKDYCKKYSIDNPVDISMLVKDVEKDGKDVPVLVKQYMKLGGRFLSFCVDQEFNCTLDGLIVVDLPGAPEKNLRMYMGDNTDGYLEYHRSSGEGPLQVG